VTEYQRGRFRMWSHSVVVHPRPIDAPEYRLDLARKLVHKQVLELIQNMVSTLQEMTEVVTGKRRPYENLSDSDTDSDTVGEVEKPHKTELEVSVEV
jgi:hypothetical protein